MNRINYLKIQQTGTKHFYVLLQFIQAIHIIWMCKNIYTQESVIFMTKDTNRIFIYSQEGYLKLIDL